MSLATVYLYKVAGEALRTRCILPHALIKTYDLPFKVSDPDSVYPSRFSKHVVPMMQWASGELQEESLPIVLAIAEQVDPKVGLLGDRSLETRSRILQWMCDLNYQFMPHVGSIFLMNVGRKEPNAAEHARNLDFIHKYAARLEAHFSTHKWLVGDSVTLADLYGCTYFLRGLEVFMDEAFRAKYPAVFEWWERAAYQDLFEGTFKRIKIVEEYKPVV